MLPQPNKQIWGKVHVISQLQCYIKRGFYYKHIPKS